MVEQVQLNVLGEPLEQCSCEPMTGFYRDGYCRASSSDRGRHNICTVMTEDFLNFSASRGNDLLTPNPAFQFPGLSPGDHWCLCTDRWVEALQAGCAPPVVLAATSNAVLHTVDIEVLRAYAS